MRSPLRGLRPCSNVRFVFDGEEENGSTNLERVLGANSALRRRSVADLRWHGCPGNLPLLTIGARAIRGMQGTPMTHHNLMEANND